MIVIGNFDKHIRLASRASVEFSHHFRNEQTTKSNIARLGSCFIDVVTDSKNWSVNGDFLCGVEQTAPEDHKVAPRTSLDDVKCHGA